MLPEAPKRAKFKNEKDLGYMKETGVVKWFNAAKGFILFSGKTGEDVFCTFHGYPSVGIP